MSATPIPSRAFGLLGMEVSEQEVRQAADELGRIERERKRKTQWTADVRRALVVVCVFFIFQQITGINVPFYFGPKLLSTFIHGGRSAAVAGVEATAILGAVNEVFSATLRDHLVRGLD